MTVLPSASLNPVGPDSVSKPGDPVGNAIKASGDVVMSCLPGRAPVTPQTGEAILVDDQHVAYGWNSRSCDPACFSTPRWT